MPEIGYLRDDLIMIYISDKTDEIGIEKDTTIINFPYFSTFCIHYLHSKNGEKLVDLYKILKYFEDNPPPQDILNEFLTQFGHFSPLILIKDMLVYTAEQEDVIIPACFPYLATLVKKFSQFDPGQSWNDESDLKEIEGIVKNFLN